MNPRLLGLLIRGIGLVFNFLLVFYVGKKFNVSFTSSFFQNFSLLMFASLVGRFGLEDLIVKLSGYDFDKKKYSFLKYSLKKIPWLISINFAIAFILFVFNLIDASFLLVSLFILLYNLNILLFSYLNGINKLVIGSIPLFVLSPLFIYANIYFGDLYNSSDLLWVYIYSYLLSLLIYALYIYIIYVKSSSISFDVELRKNSFPLAISSISGGIAIYLSIYLLGYKLSSGDLVLWTYTLKIMQLLSVVVMLLNIYFGPIYRNLFLNKNYNLIKKKLNYQILFSSFLLIPFVFIVPILFDKFVGDSKLQSVKFIDLFYIMIIGNGLSFIFSSIGSLFIMIDKQKINAYVGILFSLIFILSIYFSSNNQIIFFSIIFSVCVGAPKLILYVLYNFSNIKE